MKEVEALQVQFGIQNTIIFDEGPGGLVRVKLSSGASTVEMISHGVECDEHVFGEWRNRNRDEPITFDGETERVYVGSENNILLEDYGNMRTITVEKSGSMSTLVWNPWIGKAARMKDFGENEWREMMCIETAHTNENTVQITPGEQHIMSALIGIMQ